MSLLLVDSVCVRNQQPDRLWSIHCIVGYSNNNNKTFSAYASRPAATGLSFFAIVERILQGLYLSRPEMFHLVRKATCWPPLLVGTHQHIEEALVAGTARPAIGVLQMPFCCDMLVPKGVWQGSDNGGNERRIAEVLCERHHETLCTTRTTHPEKYTWRRN